MQTLSDKIRAESVPTYSSAVLAALLTSIHNHPCTRLTSYSVITVSAPKDKASTSVAASNFYFIFNPFIFWLHVHGKLTAVPIHSVKRLFNPSHKWGFLELGNCNIKSVENVMHIQTTAKITEHLVSSTNQVTWMQIYQCCELIKLVGTSSNIINQYRIVCCFQVLHTHLYRWR